MTQHPTTTVELAIQTEDGNLATVTLTVGSCLEITEVGDEKGTVTITVVGIEGAT